MVRKSTKIFLEIVALVTAASLIASVALVWRLSLGPLSLGFLRPEIEAALNSENLGGKVAIEDTVLVWSGWRQPFDIRAVNVALQDNEQRSLLKVDEIGLGLSLAALLEGRLALKRISLMNPQLRLTQSAGGQFSFSMGGESANKKNNDWLDELLALLQQPPQDDSALGGLQEIIMENARLVIQDQRHDIEWNIALQQLRLQRDQHGVNGVANAALEIPTANAEALSSVPFKLDFLYDNRSHSGSASFDVNGLPLPALANLHPALQKFSEAQFALNGQGRIGFSEGLRIEDARLNLSSAGGELRLTEFFPEKINLGNLQLSARFDRDTKRLILEELSANIGASTARINAVLSESAQNLSLVVEAQLTQILASDLPQLWPLGVGKNARAWVTNNIPQGIVTSANARLSGEMELDNLVNFRIDSFTGKMDYQDLEVHYVRPMPPVTAIRGSASFDRNRMDLSVTSGNLGELRVSNGTIALTALDTNDEQADIKLQIDGPLREALQILDSEPFRIVRDFGLEPSRLSAQSSANVAFAFPLKRALKIAEVRYQTKAKLRELAFSKITHGMDLSRATGELMVANDGITAKGKGMVGDIPISFDWVEKFKPGARDFTSQIKAVALLNDADRAKFGADFSEFIKGPVAVNATLTEQQKQPDLLSLQLDLAPALVALPALGIEKAGGTRGNAKLVMPIKGETITAIDFFQLDLPGLLAEGKARFAAGTKNIASIQLERLETPRSNTRISLTLDKAGRWVGSISGESLDLSPIIAAQKKADPAAAKTPFAVELALGQLWFGEGRALKNLRGRVEQASDGWEKMQLRAEAGDKPLLVDFAPASNGKHVLKADAKDAGATLFALDLYDNARGGSLNVTGIGYSENNVWRLDGAVDMRNFTIVRAPVLARLLGAMSLPGLLDLLGGEGLAFSRAKGEFEYSKNTILIRKGQAAGSSLGLTFEGMQNRQNDTLDIQGTIVPIYAVNRVLGAIPILGQILTGGDGEGMFSATYKVKGAMLNPTTSVNPLSVLAPGFLRDLFFMDKAPGKSVRDNKPAR